MRTIGKRTRCRAACRCPRPGAELPPDWQVGICPTCGGKHVLIVEEVLVHDREEANAAIDKLAALAGVARQ